MKLFKSLNYYDLIETTTSPPCYSCNYLSLVGKNKRAKKVQKGSRNLNKSYAPDSKIVFVEDKQKKKQLLRHQQGLCQCHREYLNNNKIF